MQQKVTGQHEDFPTLVIQYDRDMNTVGIGIEERATLPGEKPAQSTHPLWALYGEPGMLRDAGCFLATMAKSGEFDFSMDIPDFQTSDQENTWYECLGHAMLVSVRKSNPACDSWWTWLDRPATNRLIRLLRQARDAAFGADA